MEVKINEAQRMDINSVFKHLTVQAILDLKSLYGRVVVDDILAAFTQSSVRKTVTIDGNVACVVLIVEADGNDANVFLFPSPKAFSNKQDMADALKHIISELNYKNLYSIIYSTNNQMQRLLEAVGFEESGKMRSPAEKRLHIILRR